MQATRGACNPNLQVFIMYASHVCSQHSFGLPLRMYGNMHRTHFDHAHFFVPSITRNLTMRVLTICYVKLMQSTALEQKCFDLQSLLPALRNGLWLLLVYQVH